LVPLQKSADKKTILVAPLNWGLGHATRCIPIIRSLIENDQRVLLASDGAALALLKKEFPTLPAFSLPGYSVRYPYESMTLNLLLQLPKIFRAISREHKALQELVRTHHIQVVLSDNRYGCYSPDTYNVFMTHQLNIMAPFALTEKIIARWHKRMLERFDRVWVPDYEEALGLAGKLSHPSPVDSVRYIGPLSRMKVLTVEKKYDVIAILSGPEPQRSRLEELIIQQAQRLPFEFLLVRGKMEDHSPAQKKENITTVGHLTSAALQQAIAASEIVLARSGYTTIMDLVALHKKAILVPTPGQTEQLYLGQLFKGQGRFWVVEQGALDLGDAIRGGRGLEMRRDFGCFVVGDFIGEVLGNPLKKTEK
jgi:uncharacterized protein (TIGR00661 family)